MKNVIISIFGLQNLNGDASDDVEFVTDGFYSFHDGIAEFSYLESELTGMEGTRTQFTASPGEVIITRDGSVSMQMTFREGQKHYFMYETPFGAITMGVDTMSILQSMGENGGKLEVKYMIDMERSVVSRNQFRINIREAQGNDQSD